MMCLNFVLAITKRCYATITDIINYCTVTMQTQTVGIYHGDYFIDTTSFTLL